MLTNLVTNNKFKWISFTANHFLSVLSGIVKCEPTGILKTILHSESGVGLLFATYLGHLGSSGTSGTQIHHSQ